MLLICFQSLLQLSLSHSSNLPQRPPRTSTDLKASLEEMRANRLAKKHEKSIDSSQESSSRKLGSTQTSKSSTSASNSRIGGKVIDLKRKELITRFKSADRQRLV